MRWIASVQVANSLVFMTIPNPACPVGRNIHGILDQSLEDVQMAMEKELEKKTLAGIFKGC